MSTLLYFVFLLLLHLQVILLQLALLPFFNVATVSTIIASTTVLATIITNTTTATAIYTTVNTSFTSTFKTPTIITVVSSNTVAAITAKANNFTTFVVLP